MDAVLALGIAFADEDGQQGVVAQAVLVVEVFVAQAQAEEALHEEFGEGVLDEVGVAVVAEAAGERLDEVELGFDLAEEQSAAVGGDRPAVEAGHPFAGSEVVEKEFGCGTLCPSVMASWVGMKVLGVTLFRPTQGPKRKPPGEKYGLTGLASSAGGRLGACAARY